jgi:hypothetical protein
LPKTRLFRYEFCKVINVNLNRVSASELRNSFLAFFAVFAVNNGFFREVMV